MTQPPSGQNPYEPPTQPYGQPGPYGPPPTGGKSRGVLIGVVVLVVLLIAGGALAALLLLSDSDDDKDDDKAGDKASESTSESVSVSPTESASEPAGNLIQGNGYSYTLPDGWQDATDEAQGAPGAIDTVSVWGEQLEGGRANVIVETGTAGGETDPQALREQWVSNMSGSTGEKPQEIPGTTIDGQDAIGVQFERTNENDVEIVQTAYLVVNDGKVFSIALSGKIGDDDVEQAFEEILDSWTWE